MDAAPPPLREVLRQLPSLAPAELTPALGRLAARLHVELDARDSAEAAMLVSSAYEALRQLPASSANAAHVSSLLSVARYFCKHTRGDACLAPTRDAVAAARTLGDPGHLCKALKLLGLANARTGNGPGAVAAYAEAIELARELGDRRQEAALWTSLGDVQRRASLHGDAAACFERASRITAQDPELRRMRAEADAKLAGARAAGNTAECSARIRELLDADAGRHEPRR